MHRLNKFIALTILFILFTLLPTSELYAKKVPVFIDISDKSGIDFVHHNGMDGHLYFPEMMAGGGALIDYDQDGDLDVYLVQGGILAKSTQSDSFQHNGGHLYRNDGISSKMGYIKFTDVTNKSGIESHFYGMGAAVGDVNGDGWPDLYLTNFGHNQLWLNKKGHFVDVTETAGVNDKRWSVSASFADIDADGDLDLYVGNYVDYSISGHKICKRMGGKADYCSPKSYFSQADRLFENNGDGTFRDISLSSGITKSYGGALGVVAADFDKDGKLDIYVANDGVPNQLWLNQGNNKFENEALLAGVAVNKMGLSEASMGVDVADFDDDDDLDLFMTHMAGESNTLYVNDGSGWFDDKTNKATLSLNSRPYTSFGVVWLDYDNDMDLDLMIANGAVILNTAQLVKGIKLPLNQPNQLLENTGNAKYMDISASQVALKKDKSVSRGLLVGDLDNDGDQDVIINDNNTTPQILLNIVGNSNQWLGLSLLDKTGKKHQLGSTVTLQLSTGKKLVRMVHRDGSYASSRDPRVLFGLGAHQNITSIVVKWIDGTQEKWLDLELGKYHSIIKGAGVKLNEIQTIK